MILFESPVVTAFLIIFFGLCLGKIKIQGISFGVSAVLIISVIFGYIFQSNSYVYDTDGIYLINEYMKVFSLLGNVLFIAVVGLSAGYTIKNSNIKNMSAALIGSFMVLSSYVVLRITMLFDIGITYSGMLGALCGALTTTPGLSVVCEMNNVVPEEAVLGYGSTYIIGVFVTVVTVQIITMGKTENVQSIKISYLESLNQCTRGDLLQIALVIVLGNLLGSVNILGIDFTLGNSGGILCMGIVIGSIIYKKDPYKCMSKEGITLLRNLGLVLFFVGNGIPAGMQLYNGYSVQILIYGLFMSVTPIIICLLVCKILCRYTFSDTTVIISGGMTSTPALGVLLQTETKISYEKYSLAYLGALLTVILILRL